VLAIALQPAGGTMRRDLALLLAAVLPACAITDSDDAACVGGKCDGTEGGTCTDKRYDNGVCDPMLDCATPDIDCFRTFKTDEEAATWYLDFEAKVAAETGAPPRKVMTTHPDFARVRALLDRGWEAFGANRPVGLLKDRRPALVFVEDPAVNAFVAPSLDFKSAGFAVMVHTGLVAQSGFSDDAMLGLMMHELQHAVGLHVLPEVKAKFKRFYLAANGSEPIGRTQAEDARVREAATQWLTSAGEIGALANVELGGMPFSGDLNRVLRTVFQSGLDTNAAACMSAQNAINALSIELGGKIDPISGAVVGLDASFKTRVDNAFTLLRTDCLPNFTMSFVEVVASIAGVTPDQIEASLSDEDKQLVRDKHVVEAIRVLGEDRRAKLRAIEADFARQTGVPWTAVRYFSTEEDADDTSVPVLRNAGLAPTGLGDFLANVLPAEQQAKCRALIDDGKVPPYGADLVDDHHGTCWRVYHIGAYAKHTDKAAMTARLPVDAPAPKRLLPPTLRDVVMY
jgi:hypothetical protein